MEEIKKDSIKNNDVKKEGSQGIANESSQTNKTTDLKLSKAEASPKDLISKNTSNEKEAPKTSKSPKTIKPEEKPFEEFILNHLFPGLNLAFEKEGIKLNSLKLTKGVRPVVGGNCSYIYAKLPSGRQFWLAFSTDDIRSKKTIALAETGSEPDTLESFLIDEKKTTLQLLISRIIQRLNGQKWLGPN